MIMTSRRIKAVRNADIILVRKLEGKTLFVRTRRRSHGINKMELEELGFEGVDWT
jgi:hypothetical protein